MLNVKSLGSFIDIVNDLVVALNPNWSCACAVNVYVLSILVVLASNIPSFASNVVKPDTANPSYSSHFAVSPMNSTPLVCATRHLYKVVLTFTISFAI